MIVTNSRNTRIDEAMNARTAWVVIRWVVRDTFRQTVADGVAWLALFVSLACILACLSVTIEPDDGAVPAQHVRALFGLVEFTVVGDRPAAVRAVHASVAGLFADTFGVLLLLLWTAAVLPGFLAPSAITVLLAKPVPRWSLIAGKCLGVLAFVAVQALVFVGGTAVALGWRTGWEGAYLLCLPLALIQFFVFFSFSAMLAVMTRGTVASLFGTMVFWLLCWAMNLGRHALRSSADLRDAARSMGSSVELGYWILPRPLDLHLILGNALGAPPPTGALLDLPYLTQQGLWQPGLSVLASLAFAAVLFAVAAYDFLSADY
jgi:ABC-type transport system involved in multi-copper enzyme maturation permease subunit